MRQASPVRLLSALAAATLCALHPARAQQVSPIDTDAARTRALAVDTASLAASAPGAGLTLHLFDDAIFTLQVEHREPVANGFTLAGSAADPAGRAGTFSLSVVNGHLSAGVWIDGRAFGLVPSGALDAAGRALCTAREFKPGATTRCAMGPGVLPLHGFDDHGVRAVGPTPEPDLHAPQALGGGPPPTGACACHDDQSTVDLLVVYTPAALAGAGGLPALQARVADAVAATNQAYTNSAITAGGPVNRLSIQVAGYQQIAYDEVSPQWFDHLIRVTETADGHMDNVHALRDAVAADLVMLVTEDTRFFGGAAWHAHATDTRAFSVLNWRAIGGGSLTFAHELGHNFGCAHDRANDTFSPFRWAWGHNFAANATTYGTIMSYVGVNQLPNFSNPNVIHSSGQPTGVPLNSPLASHNALTIATTHWTIASYRDEAGMLDCNGNGVPDATDIANGTSQDANHNCRPDDCEVRLYVDANNTGTVDGLSWNTAWTSLADALSFASMKCSNVSEIWIADGTYTPDNGSGDRNARFTMRTGLALVGGFQGKSRPGGGETSAAQRIAGAFPSILSGDIGVPGTHTDNSFNVIFAENTDSTAVLDGFTVERGYQDFDGGGMYASNSSVTVRGCTFRNNRGGAGAALAVSGVFSSPKLTSCLFESNTTLYSGGALQVRSGAQLTVEGSTLRLNTAGSPANPGQGFGGALSASVNCAVTIRACTIEDNTAQVNSGALDIFSGSTLTVENTTLQRNHSLSSSGAAGAIGLQASCTATLTDSTIADNDTLGQGGGLFCHTSSATLTRCLFRNNIGQSVGGGLTAYGPATLVIDQCTFRNNRGAWGGGLFCNGLTLTVRRTLLEANRANAGSGGGMHLFNVPATLTNVALHANTASDDAGALSLSTGTSAAISNCTIYANTAADVAGGIGMNQAVLTLRNSILYANLAVFGTTLDRQLYLFAPASSSTRTVNRSCVQGMTDQMGGSGNIGANPALVNPASGDLALGAGSPCIDSASNALVPAGATLDLAGNPRFADDPATADTGVGTPPIVDMGAREFIPPAACPADMGMQGGIPGQDGLLNNNDFVVFINFFFSHDPRADVGRQGGISPGDGLFDNNDFVVFINLFFSGC